jgi:16S rRNA G966 N2-methylase RsmD
MPTELFPYDQIDIQDRIRGVDEDIPALADSIKRYGLLQPILLNQHNTLVDGWRRFTAWCSLAKADGDHYALIPVHRREQMSEAEYFELELETNIRRRQFSWRENIKAVCRVHYTRRREAVLAGGTAASWTLAMSGELLGGYGHTYVYNCLNLEPFIDTPEFKDCEGITDAVRLFERKREDSALARMAEMTALQQTIVPTINNAGNVVVQQPPSDIAALLGVDPGELIVNLSQCLFNGDSVRDILPSWPDACVDHIITDPPYGIDVDMMQQSSQALMDVSRVSATHQVRENEQLFLKMFPLFYRILKDSGFLVLWCDAMQWQQLYNLATSAGFRVQRWPHVWCKTSQCKNQMAHQNETKATEFAMLCRKGNATLPRPIGKNFTLASGMDNKLSNPFAKPFEVWEPLINGVSIEGQVILDPFAGEGTCPLAALRLRRPVIAMEVEPTHFNYMLESVKAHWRSMHPNVKFI